jgi:hypothetical protein
MSEGQGRLWEPTFNRCIKVRQQDQRITSDSGVLLLREVDHSLGLIRDLAAQLNDPRDQDLIRYTLTELLRQRIFGLALGYHAQDDLDRLAQDPAFKLAVWDRPGQQVLEERLASQPTHSRLLEMLCGQKDNLEALRAALPTWVLRHQRAQGKDQAPMRGTLDIDSFPIEVHGHQAGGAYNGHYKLSMYHPMVASFSAGGDYDSARLGDGFVHAILRKGNAASAAGAVRFIQNAIQKCGTLARSLDVRFDAIFTVGSIMDPLTDAGIRFLGRLKSNSVLDKLAEPHLFRLPGRPPKEGYEHVIELGPHRAESWRHAQRLLLVIVDRPDSKTGQLQLMPDYFFLVTNWKQAERSGPELLAHYRRRGTFEDRFGEFNASIGPNLSSPQFAENEATFLLSLLAFNLGGILRGEMEKATGSGWDLGRVVGSVLKAGGRVVKGGHRLMLDIAAAAAPLWRALLDRLKRWRRPQARMPKPRPWVAPPAHAHLGVVLRM